MSLSCPRLLLVKHNCGSLRREAFESILFCTVSDFWRRNVPARRLALHSIENTFEEGFVIIRKEGRKGGRQEEVTPYARVNNQSEKRRQKEKEKSPRKKAEKRHREEAGRHGY